MSPTPGPDIASDDNDSDYEADSDHDKDCEESINNSGIDDDEV